MDYIYGKLNEKVKEVDYFGKDSDTANVIIDEKENKIQVNVKKTPNSLKIIKGIEEKTFNGSEQVDIVVPNINENDIVNKGTYEADKLKTEESINNLKNSKIDSYKLNEDLLIKASIKQLDEGTVLETTTLNIDKDITKSNKQLIPLVNEKNSGLMSSKSLNDIKDLKNSVEQLKGKTTRLLYSVKTDPSAEEINQFVIGLGYTFPFEGIAVVVDETFHIWHFYDNLNIWKDDGIDTVNTFTNTLAGVIKGSIEEGKISANEDGTGSVVGFENKISKAVNQNILYGTDDIGNQVLKRYNSEPITNDIVERTPDGRIKSSEPKEFNDVVTVDYLKRNQSSLDVINAKLVKEPIYTLTDDWEVFKFPQTPSNLKGRNIWITSTFDVIFSDGQFNYNLPDPEQGWIKIELQDNLGNNILFEGQDIWEFEGQIYLSTDTLQYRLENYVWIPIEWVQDGFTTPIGRYIWHTDTNIYYSNGSIQYELQTELGKWVPKDWGISIDIYGNNIWNNLGVTYYSDGQHQLKLENGVWVEMNWNGFKEVIGKDIWKVKNSVYYSNENNQFELIDNTWNSKIWNNVTNLNGEDIWVIEGFVIIVTYSNNEIQNNLVTIESGGWMPLEPNYKPYTVKQTTLLDTIVEDNSILTLLNTDPLTFINYGFTLINPTQNTVDVLAFKEPENEVSIVMTKQKGKA